MKEKKEKDKTNKNVIKEDHHSPDPECDEEDSLNEEQRETLGFPKIGDLPKYMKDAIYARYPKLSKL